ncbi:uncharacterized protein LOC108264148 isoform X9 [Ictalurus punctatus]|uniref:Uncharacterized protein LOC108264148 isoform X9 n=1 Tax=Ictalurus punctatus TaxID=7998 RepID=A0A9F7R302_ICTPU|nr:uncharacterized protein LOC108264148 isoform X9 [Ictalurus punctatus]
MSGDFEEIRTTETSLSEGQCKHQRENEERPNSPETSCVSFKSDQSKPLSINFKEGTGSQERGTEERPNSPLSSCVSYKSDQSKPLSINFKEGTGSQERGTEERRSSPVASCVSFKSDQSKPLSINFKEGTASQEIALSSSLKVDQPLRGTDERPKSPVSKCLSLKSNQSKPLSINFNERTDSQERQNSSPARQLKNTPSTDKTTGIHSKERNHCESEATVKTAKLEKKITDFLYNIFNDLENKMTVFIKHELEMFKKFLRKENTKYYGDVRDDLWSIKEATLDMALYFLKMMDHGDLADALQDALIGIQQRALKSNLCKKYNRVCEGIAKQGESNILNKIYTDLYITAGGSGQIKEEHEVRQIEKQKTSVKNEKNQMEQEEQIECKNMFEPLSEEDKRIRTVVTQGVAGIGKSICVQKFVLDWAEGKEYQDIKFIFPLPFRELNLKEKKERSLREIIYHFFPEAKGLRFTDRYKVMFIFDGLDECRLPLTFLENVKLTDASMGASLDTIVTNLIEGNLLPSALIWITTRPAAAGKIPAEHVDRITEVRGFNDVQKVEYFRKKISDESLANRIIDHIKGSRSLFIMCHIPVFCWISATVLEGILGGTDSEDIPQTLTEMYTCFLIFQTVQGDKKYNRKCVSDIPWDKEGILSLGKLAFSHLEKNNLIFYEQDLNDCGIDPNNIKVYSGVCTQETSRFLGTVFSFVHLSIQEFIAALFTYVSHRNENKNVFEQPEESKETKEIDLLKITVDKALESDKGHLDLFLRFLLGLSVESNQKLIRGLLTHRGSSSDCQKDIVDHIKTKLEENPSPERSINLFYCLKELNDDSLVKEIQSYMSSGRLSEADLSPARWSALVFVLLTSEEDLEVFELQKFIKSDECFKRLLPVVREATTALLSECNLTERSCSALHTVLSSESSKLTEVDLSSNTLEDSGVKLLCAGLKSPNCKLEKLRLSDCNITEEGYAALAEALKSNLSSNLIELDLRGNDPGTSGVKLLTDVLQDQNCKLSTLRLLKSADAEKACDFLNEVLGKNPLLQRELDLSGKIKGDSGVKQLSVLLEDSHCRPERLMLKNCGITEKGCSSLTSSFQLNPVHIKEMDLSENKLRNSGVQELCALLKHQPCNLQILRLSDCSITQEGYRDLAEALKSSHLIELDLRGNDPGASGVKLLTDVLQDPHCTLKTLRLLKSPEAEKACKYLTEVLGTTPLLQRELDLSGKIKGDSRVKRVSVLLKDPHCRPEKLTLTECGLMMESCQSLAEVLSSPPCFLTELDLSNNNLQNSGVQQLSEGLKNQSCVLKILRLSDCSITEEGYAALAEALKSSHLIELDLRGNDPGASGVKLLTDALQDPHCTLKTLRLLKSRAAQEGYELLYRVLNKNPLLQRELDVSEKINGDSEVKQLSALLQDSHCRPEILKVNNVRMRNEGCAALASALSLNPSHLRQLELSGNTLRGSGMKELCGVLKNQQFKLLKLGLCKCSLTEEDCTAVVSALRTNPSLLKELDLSENTIGNTGVKELSDLLQNPNCTLEKLKLSNCSLTQTQCGDLAKALECNSSSHLKELDLRGNYSVSRWNIFSYFLGNSNSKLIVRILSPEAEKACDFLTKVLGTNPLLQRELDLSGKISGDSEVKQLSVLLKDRQCRTEKLRLSKSGITERGCTDLISALTANPSHLTELDLSENTLGKTGVEKISTLLKSSSCKLQKLVLSDCNITEKGYTALAKALKSNRSSHLINLDLRGNDPGASGMKEIRSLMNDTECKLTLRLLKSPDAQKAYDHLREVLGINPILQTDLDLSGKIEGDSGVEQLSALLKDLLKDPHCRPEKLQLSECNLTEKGCSALLTALRSESSTLRELNLSKNRIQDSGVKLLSAVLKNKDCKLETVRLSDCNITEKGYTALTKALKSNRSSHLMNLDLRGNDPGDSGMKEIRSLMNDTECKLTLRLLKSPDAQKACDHLREVLGINPILQTDLDLSGKIEGDSGVEQLSALLKDLLKDPHCRPEKLQLSECNLTEKGCSALLTALRSESSTLRELNLSRNRIQDSGVKLLSAVLKNKDCKLETVRLSDCSITEEGYAALAEALKSSHLIELDLRGNDPGDSGMTEIRSLMNDTECKLTLRLLKSPDAQKAYDHLSEVLGINPILQTDLDLSGKIEGDSGVEQLSALLKDPHCRPEKLQLSECNLTEKGCSALLTALRSESSTLRELNLSKNRIQDSGVKLLSAVLKNKDCKLETVRLSECNLTERSCSALHTVLSSESSKLTEVDLSSNPLEDSGVKLLCAGLKSPNCNLEKLRLSDCNITEEGYAALAEALKSSHLIELDLRGNDPGASGVKLLTDVLQDPHCTLETLRLLKSAEAEEACKYLTEVLGTTPLLQRELDLSGKISGDSRVKQLSVLLKDPHCRPERLTLSDCSITEEGYAALAEALKSSHLIELDLRGNDPGASGVKLLTDVLQDPHCTLETLSLLKSPAAQEACTWLDSVLGKNSLLQKELDLSMMETGDSGVEKLSALLEDSHCKFQKIRLNKCNLTEESCSALASVLNLKSCSVRELDLSNNSLQDSGVTRLSAGLKSPQCKLEILRLKTCLITAGSCSALAEVLSSEYSQLRELDLSNNSLQDSGVTQLSAGLKTPQSRLTIIRLCNCSVEAEGCAALATALEENPSHLLELDLSENKAGDSGMKQISNLLQNSLCVLQKLNVTDNNITEEGYAALAEALKSSHLIELDLRGNDPGASGVKLLTDVLQDPHCTLETLRLLKSPAAQEGYELLYRVLNKNPLLQRELDVSEKINGDSEVKQLSALLQDSHCRPEILKVNNVRMRNEGCAALASALSLNPSHLRQLELSGNTLRGSGMKELCGVLKNQQFKLLKLGLCKCSLTEEDCAAVVSALRTNPSLLKELDLSENTIGNTGVKELSDLLQNPNCTLEILKLSKCSLIQTQCGDLAKALECNSSSHLKELDLRGNYSVSRWDIFSYFLWNSNSKLIVGILSPEAEKACDFLTKVLGTNPLLQRELDLSGKISGDSEVKQLSVLLKDRQCRTEKLRLSKSGITERGCTDLISALTANPSHLTELDLSENTLGNPGVEKISTLLKSSSCKLQKLVLSDCNITEKGYTALTKALKSNRSSHLMNLDLRGNDPGASGVKLLTDYKANKLTLRLLKSADAEEAYKCLTDIFRRNPLLHTELDLSNNTPEHVKVKHLSALLQDPHYRLQKLTLYKEGSITEDDCSHLTSALVLNPSHLRALDLNRNKAGESGVRNLCDFLKNPKCNLQKLKLWNSVNEKSCTDLVPALCTNPSHIRELDLSLCRLGDSGVEKLCDLLKKHECKLETLRLKKCSITDRGCASLTAALRSNSSHLKELDLRENQLNDSVTKQLSEILKSSGGKLICDKPTATTKRWNLFSGSKSDEQPISDPDSSTVKNKQRDGKMQDTQQGESSVDSLGSNVD